MIYHVLPGDSLVEEFKKTKIAGETIVCRECLVVGPVEPGPADEFWDRRAKFILTEYGEDEILFQERVADELERLGEIESGDEVNLWFEYELFCSVNMWFCMAQLTDSAADVYRVEPGILSVEDRWQGFGRSVADDLKMCFEGRKKLAAGDLKLGADLWDAFARRDAERLDSLSDPMSECFPYLREVCDAAIEIDTSPAEIVAEIVFEGKTEFADIFAEFSNRAGVYGFGDLQVQRLLDRSSLL
jgi:hypothetical protein